MRKAPVALGRGLPARRAMKVEPVVLTGAPVAGRCLAAAFGLGLEAHQLLVELRIPRAFDLDE